MPIYEYRCDSCGRVFEVIQKFSDEPLALDPECGKGPVERLISAPSFQFKGTGFYITDYAKGKDGGANVPAPAGKSGESKSSDGAAASTSSESTSSSNSKSSDNKSSESKSSDSKPSESKSSESKSESSSSSTKTESKPASKD